jgi:hypothetical protein
MMMLATMMMTLMMMMMKFSGRNGQNVFLFISICINRV